MTRYDLDRSGFLDRKEFLAMCTENQAHLKLQLGV